MQDDDNYVPPARRRTPWNKGKLIGTKPPLRQKHVWAIRTKLQIDGRTRDLAMFNLAIDSKLPGSDVVAVKVEDVAPRGYAVDCVPGAGSARAAPSTGPCATTFDAPFLAARRTRTGPVLRS